MSYPYSGVIPNKVIDFLYTRVYAIDIINAVCKDYGITKDAIFSRNRGGAIREPRQIAMYLIRKFSPELSLEYIGRTIFRGMDHSTVINAVNRIKGLIESNEEYAERINNIELTLTTG